MSNNVQNFDIYAGDDRTLSMTARDYDRSVKDITAHTLAFKASRVAGDPAEITATGTIVSGTAGTFTVALASADTSSLDGDYEYDVVATSGSTDTTVVTGRLRVNKRNAASS